MTQRRMPSASRPTSNDNERTVVDAGGGAGVERTILMPAPGGQPTMVAQRPAEPEATRTSGRLAAVEFQRMVAGVNPLLGAANVLLALIAQLRTTSAHADPAGLRRQLLERMHEFETRAGAAGVSAHHVGAARYLLSSFIDEVVDATPWGEGGAWAERNLLQEFHDERWGGDKSFKLLDRLMESPAANRNLLELFYVCLVLGFEGRYRGLRNGREQLEAIAQRVLEAVHPAKDRRPARSLALYWEGVDTQGNRDLALPPVWVVFAIGAALVLGVVLWVNTQLDRLAQPVFRQIYDLPATLRVERANVASKPRLAPLLQADVASGAIAVRDEALRSVVTVPADALFSPGGAALDAHRASLFGRIAHALQGTPGQVVVTGHTDSEPTGSLQFPSNWNLSRARAQAVMDSLVQQGLKPERVRAEGHADVEPRVKAATPAERAQNRRIEIELLLTRPDL
jgi:type VI secretion system protein ImpK